MDPLIADILLIAVIAGTFILACVSIYRQKKKQNHCLGCMMADTCKRTKSDCTKSQ